MHDPTSIIRPRLIEQLVLSSALASTGAISFACVSNEAAQSAVAEKLTLRTHSMRCERAKVNKRFKFVRPPMGRMCVDRAARKRVTGVIVAGHRQVREMGSGRQEPILQRTGNMYQFSLDIAMTHKAAGFKTDPLDRCTNALSVEFSMAARLRRG